MNHKIKVLHYVSGFAETAGGIESFLYNVYEVFQESTDSEICLLTRYCYKDSKFYNKFILKGYRVESLDIQHLGIKQLIEFKNRLDMFFQNNQFDILHMHGTDEPMVISFARKHGVKNIVLHSHTTDMEMNGRKLWMRYIKLLWRKRNILSADYYAGCSKDVLDTVFLKIGNERKFLIKNGIDTSKYRFNLILRKNLRQELGIKDEECVIGHVGRFVDTKNHPFMLEILKYAKQRNVSWKLILIGNGHEYKNVIKQADSLGIREDILFLGERSNINELMNVFDKFIFPSKFEGLGMTVVEAQANGLPCVISNIIPQEVIVTDLVKMVGLEQGVEQWFDVLNSISLCNSREEYATRVSNGGYGLNLLYESLMKMYRRVLNEG